MSTNTQWLAGARFGASDSTKYHACDPASARQERYGTYYTARCGQRHLSPTGQRTPFMSILRQERCQRCETLVGHAGRKR